jgi:hypothetical protein
MQPTELQLHPDQYMPAAGHLPACSLCLRVLRNDKWIQAEAAIRALRSYELPAPISLGPGLCDRCTDTLAARR